MLRALLGIRAYIVSLVFRVPPERTEESLWGTVLRVVSFIVEAGLLALGLRELLG